MRDKKIKICKKNLQGNPYKEAWEKINKETKHWRKRKNWRKKRGKENEDKENKIDEKKRVTKERRMNNKKREKKGVQIGNHYHQN